jgi:hypothetical protein
MARERRHLIVQDGSGTAPNLFKIRQTPTVLLQSCDSPVKRRL